METADAKALVRSGSSPWIDLGLTLPIFVGYHLGVVFLNVRNAADLVTRELVALSKNNLLAYGGLTLAIGAIYVGILLVLGRGRALRWERFAIVAAEGIAYAVAMRLIAAYVVGRVFLAPGIGGTFAALVMSLGAGFYEEIVFRVLLFGLGVRVILLLFPIALPLNAVIVKIAWAVVTAGIFSGWHYVGPLGEAFEVQTFVFRWVCGVVFCAVYWFRGFAPTVWTHALYDIWALVL